MKRVRVKYPYTYKKADFVRTKYKPDGTIEATRTAQFAYHVRNTGLDFMNPVIWRDTKWDWWTISDGETGATLTKVVIDKCSRNAAVAYFVDCFSGRTEAEFQERIEAFKTTPHNMGLFIGS